MSSVQMLDTAFNNSELPRFKFFDEIETEGSLLLVNPKKWGSIPANGALIDDNFRVVSDEVLNAYGQTYLTFDKVGDITKYAVSIDGDGGFRYAPSPNAGAVKAGNVSAGITVTGGLKEYLLANLGHSFYSSVWLNIEPLADGTGAVTQYASNFSNGSSNNPSAFITPFTNASTGLKMLVGQSPVNAANLTSGHGFCIFNGGLHGFNAAFLNTVSAKENIKTFYRFYLEDLTVSGRTAADVTAIDTRLFNEFVAALS